VLLCLYMYMVVMTMLFFKDIKDFRNVHANKRLDRYKNKGV